MSHLLGGRRNVTQATIEKFSEKIGLSPQQIKSFKDYHLKKQVSDKTSSSIDLNQLTLDQFQIISDWYHYAILELLEIETFQSTPKWIANALGISVSEVNTALERLQRLKFITKNQANKWINISGDNTTVGNNFTAVAFRNLQRQILEKAVTALENLPMEKREQSSLTMAMDSELLPEIKACAKKFRRQLLAFQKRSRKKDQVYHLSVSFYPILENLLQENNA